MGQKGALLFLGESRVWAKSGHFLAFLGFSGSRHFGEIRISSGEKSDPLAPRFREGQKWSKMAIFENFGLAFEAVKAQKLGFFKNGRFWSPLVGGHFGQMVNFGHFGRSILAKSACFRHFWSKF